MGVQGDWEALTIEGEDEEQDSIEFPSKFSSVGDNNALRETIQSYLNIRITHNRNTSAFNTVYTDDVLRNFNQRSKMSPQTSVFTREVNEEDWANFEYSLYVMDGSNAEPDMDPMHSGDELSGEEDIYDTEDSISTDEQDLGNEYEFEEANPIISGADTGDEKERYE